MDIFIWFWIVQAVLCAFFAGTIGSAKGRDSASYFIGGLFFGLFGLILAAGMPTREAERLEKKRDSENKERARLAQEKFREERKQAELEKSGENKIIMIFGLIATIVAALILASLFPKF